MGTFSSGFSQVGSVTIVGNQNVLINSPSTYAITGTSCSTANWIVGGGTIVSSNNISCTVQWNNNSGNGYISVNSYNCLPTPENRSGFLSINKINRCIPTVSSYFYSPASDSYNVQLCNLVPGQGYLAIFYLSGACATVYPHMSVNYNGALGGCALISIPRSVLCPTTILNVCVVNSSPPFCDYTHVYCGN